MADTPKSTAPDQGDGSTNKPTPGIPDPNPTLPDASIEPAAQVASATATDGPKTHETPETVAPPIPADYEMPDDYATEGTLEKARVWAEAHPGLAVLAAAGAGLVIGRIVTGLFPDPEPPSLADRVEKKAKVLQKQAKKQGKDLRKQASVVSHDAGESLQDLIDRASHALRDAAGTAGDAAEDGYEKTKDFAEHLSDAVKVAITGVLASKIDDWVKR